MDTIENNNQNESPKGCFSTVGGCLLKIVGLIFAFIVIMFVKTCIKSIGGSAVKNSAPSEYVPTDKNTLDAQIYRVMDKLRADMPQKIDEITTQKDVEMDEDYFYYICDIDDSQSDFANIDDETLKSVQKKGLISLLPGMRKMIEILVSTNRGLAYRYYCTSSGITKTISFSKQELQALLNNE